eukprot:TRINITY_DN353_c0_g3_i1.p1 TRINITY_DN353_c0_g3~~TRINITY_DN353_c0_g3_i1.p1  ORF type:complete len:622 (+),score=141.89 TRINITY_DN353_c0_g3_i1:43-1866(+)
MAPKAVKPPEEVIRLDAGDGEVPVERPSRTHGDRKTRGQQGGLLDEKEKRKDPKRAKHLGLEKAIDKYERGRIAKKDLKVTGDKKLATEVKKRSKSNREAAFQMAKAEVLQTEESGYIKTENDRDDTRRITQADILDSAGIGVAKKYFSFDLPFGPYCCSFTRNGQHLLAGGKKGHVALLHCDSMQINTETHTKETIRAVTSLHNHMMFAVAQKKYVYIYDNQGIELHCLKQQKYPVHLDFLPYHYLLVSTGSRGELTYRDISYGVQVAEHRTRLGQATCMRQNPKNAVMHLGHAKGLVTLWTPSVKEPVVKMFCHNAQVTALAVNGNYMVTAGSESKWKVWDLRMYKEVHDWRTFGHAVSSVDVSQTGLVSIGHGAHFEVWKDALTASKPKRPFITESYRGRTIECVRFRPFEDVCAVGHSDGFGSLIIPGAGHANFDSFEVNPYETRSQRREREVQSLLDKLPSDSIMLDPDRIGNIDKGVVKRWREDEAAKQAEAEKEAKSKEKEKKKMRGKNKAGNRLKKKHLQDGRDQRSKAKARNAGEDGDSDESDDDDDDDDVTGDEGGGGSKSRGGGGGKQRDEDDGAAAPEGAGPALSRFYGKRRRKT